MNKLNWKSKESSKNLIKASLTRDEQNCWQFQHIFRFITLASVAVGSGVRTLGILLAPAVVVVAASAADPARLSSAPVDLKTVTISLSPSTIALSPSQKQLFSVVVGGTSNAAVAWSLSPNVGSLVSTATSAVYVAPNIVNNAQKVTITVTSSSDTSKSAVALVTLVPAVSVSLSPSSAKLAPLTSQQFDATVAGTSNTSVNWFLIPQVGSISSTGLYTAPANNAGIQTVTVMALSRSDATRTAAATVSLAPLTYYVDSISGSDANQGTSQIDPWKTIAKVNATVLLPGQTVAFKAGDEWHETLSVSQSGQVNLPITYTSFGAGAQPIVSAADAFGSGWLQGKGTAPQEGCAASCIFASGFETPGLTDWNGTSGGNPVAVSSAHPAHGSFDLQFGPASAKPTNGYVTKNFGAMMLNNTYYFRFYVWIPAAGLVPNQSIKAITLGRNGAVLLQLFADSGGNVAQLAWYDTVNSIDLCGGRKTISSTFAMGAWNEVEVAYSVSSSAGGGQCFLNGSSIGSYLGANTSSSVGYNSLTLGDYGFYTDVAAGGFMWFDDFKMGAGIPQGGFSAGIPTNVWYHPQSTNPKLINFNGQAGTLVTSVGAIVGSNQFYWDGSSTLYASSLQDPLATIEIPRRSAALSSSGASNITVSNIEFRGGQTDDVLLSGGSTPFVGWNFENNRFDSAYSNGLHIQTYAGIAASEVIVKGNTFAGLGGAGIALTNAGATAAQVTGNQIFDVCTIYDPSVSSNQFCDAINLFSQLGTDGSGAYIADNNIHDVGVGIFANYGGGIHADTVSGTNVENNVIQNTNGVGLNIEKGFANTANYNSVTESVQFAGGSGLAVRAGDGSNSVGATLSHNTIKGGAGQACTVAIDNDNGMVSMTGLNFSYNICLGSLDRRQFWADAGWDGTGNAYFGNTFGPAALDFIYVAGKGYSTYSSLPSLLSSSVPGIQ